MESSAIADSATRLDLPMLTVRMISDGLYESIPGIFTGRPRINEIPAAVGFAVRMLSLTRKLADRLEAVVRDIGNESET